MHKNTKKCISEFGYQISFIEDEQERNFFILYTCKNCIVLWGDSGGSINYKYSNICLVQDLIGFLDTKFSEFSCVIETWSVNHDNRTKWK